MKVHLVIECPEVAEGIIKLNANHIARNLGGHVEMPATAKKPEIKNWFDRLTEKLGFELDEITEIVP